MTITLALCWAASQATGLTLRQEVVFVPRAGDVPANVQRLGEVFANGDGAYTLVVRTGIDRIDQGIFARSATPATREIR